MSKTRDTKVTHSSGNVFADLGFEDADDRLAKSELALQIAKVIKGRRMTQAVAAERLGIDQPKISRLVQGKLHGFSTAQLMRFLNALGHDVEIIVRERPRQKRGKLSVHAA
jgi:predicted XRE-type DNA-binding protein